MNLELREPSFEEFQLIKKYISDFELDNRSLKQSEFIAAFRNEELVGFGRIRSFEGCSELCSLGVVTNHRRKGIGKALVSALIKKARSPLYLVCIIPEYFTPFDFTIIETNIPENIKDKIRYCTSELVVPEKYVAMKYSAH